jgi:hypothetical protein
MPKFTAIERTNLQNLIANLSIKRVPDNEIMKEVFNQTGKTISRKTLVNVRQRIKKDSFKWYKTMREGEYEYIHEFKERINEIVDLQKRHHKIIEDNANNPNIQQTSLSELHKLNITLSNYFDVAPTIVTNPSQIKRENNIDNSLSIPQQDKDIIV